MVRMLHEELSKALENVGIPDARFDVQCMISQCCGKDFRLVSAVSTHEEQEIRHMAARRLTGEPLQYILGEWEFYGMRLFVGEGVLIPRPDTEILVETVLQFCKNRKSVQIADLCSGSGCIALALEAVLPEAQVYAVEKSDRALSYLRRNAEYHHSAVRIHHADVLDPKLPACLPKLDVIVSNPPYLTEEEMCTLQREVQHEPDMALAGGSDGLHFYREITRLWKASLVPGGLLAFEVGDKQAEQVSEILRAQQFSEIRSIPDLAGIPRVVHGIA